jgi:NAD(P)-dependent dehydrogenase (short-subunit alcohol dehydrogenase family)
VCIFNVGANVKFSVLDTSVRVYTKVSTTTLIVTFTAMTCAQAIVLLISASPRLIGVPPPPATARLFCVADHFLKARVCLNVSFCRQVWEMACLGGFISGRECAKRMVERERGTIIFTGATASMRGASGFTAFAGAKHALRALAQSMARELGPKGVHVCHVVIDGAVDTVLTNAHPASKTPKISSS